MFSLLRGPAFVWAIFVLTRVGSTEFVTTRVFLDEPSEFSVNASPGTGQGKVTMDTTAHTVQVMVSSSDLNVGAATAHIRGPADRNAAVPTADLATMSPVFVGFAWRLNSGFFDTTFDTTRAGTDRVGLITASWGAVAGAGRKLRPAARAMSSSTSARARV